MAASVCVSAQRHIGVPAAHSYRFIYCTSCSYRHVVPVYCSNRFCPTCSGSRSRKIRDRLKDFLTSYSPANGYSVKFLTLTIPPASTPGESARTLVKSFRALRRQRYWRDNVAGGVFVIEASRRPGNFHIHLHIVLDSRYLDFRTLLECWKRVSPGQGVFITRIPIGAVVNYLTKYITKSSIPPADQVYLSDELKDFRLVQLFGSWHGHLPPARSNLFPCPNCGQSCWFPDYLVAKNLREMRALKGVRFSPL